MSYTWFRDDHPKARKPHRCELCDRTINKGEIHTARIGTGEDGPQTFRMHTICKAATDGWGYDEWQNRPEPYEFRADLARSAQLPVELPAQTGEKSSPDRVEVG